MPDRISTDSLMKRLFRTKSIASFMQNNERHLEQPDFCAMLKTICGERELVPERVILQAQIDRTYGHQLFSGIRKPSRDKVIQLAIGIGLNVEETQRLLQAAGKSPLYPRLKRDAAILYCIRHGYSVLDTQDVLDQYSLSLLGNAGN